MEPSEIDRAVHDVMRGERERYRMIVRAFEAQVRWLLAFLLPDRAAIDDLLQEVFVTAYLKIGEYQPGTDFAAWLRTIARNRAQNERRRWHREQRFKTRYGATLAEAQDAALLPVADAADQQPTVKSLRECLESLGGLGRSVVQLFYIEGRPIKEIGAMLEREPNAIKVALFRARASLGRCLHQKGVEFAGEGNHELA